MAEVAVQAKLSRAAFQDPRKSVTGDLHHSAVRLHHSVFLVSVMNAFGFLNGTTSSNVTLLSKLTACVLVLLECISFRSIATCCCITCTFLCCGIYCIAAHSILP